MYLSSNLFKGIGPSIAKQIVDMFGSNTIEEIKKGNSLILNVKGMNERKFENLVKTLRDNTLNQELILKLNDLGFNTKEAMKLITKYKENILNIIENNIYFL